MKYDDTALVIVSGGQDSATCLAWAKDSYSGGLHAFVADYGQRNREEIAFARRNSEDFGCKSFMVADMTSMSSVAKSALFSDQPMPKPSNDPNVPSGNYVPNRNALILGYAHCYAQAIGATVIVTGIGQHDRSDAHDCQPAFMDAIELALNLGSDTKIEIVCPRMHMTKAQVWMLADELDVVDYIIHQTLTCHRNDHETMNTWGRGCGECNPCKLRAKGYEEYLDMKHAEPESLAR